MNALSPLVCPRCPHRDVFLEDMKRAANDNHPSDARLYLPPDAMLRRPDVVQRLAVAIRSLNIPRREVPNFIEDAVRRCPVPILNEDGSPFCRCGLDVDAAFNDDGSFRWVSDFLGFAATPPKQKAQARTVSRLRLLYLALAIECPTIAAGVVA